MFVGLGLALRFSTSSRVLEFNTRLSLVYCGPKTQADQKEIVRQGALVISSSFSISASFCIYFNFWFRKIYEQRSGRKWEEALKKNSNEKWILRLDGSDQSLSNTVGRVWERLRNKGENVGSELERLKPRGPLGRWWERERPETLIAEKFNPKETVSFEELSIDERSLGHCSSGNAPLLLPSMGEGGGDYGPEFQDFLFLPPSPRPSPARGEGVSGWKLDGNLRIFLVFLFYGFYQ